MKVRDLFALRDAIDSLARERMDFQVAYALQKNAAALGTMLETFEDQRKMVVDEYAEKGEDGQPAIGENQQYIFNGNHDAAMDAFNGLLDAEVDDDEFKRLPMAQLSGVQMSPAQVAALAPLIEEGD